MAQNLYDKKTHLVATPSALVYSNDNQFAIFKTRDGYSLFGEVIDEPKSLVGEQILFIGKWETYKGKPTFRFQSYQIQENQTFFFLTKIVRGIPVNTARQIANRFSDEELDYVIQNEPQKLLEFKHIKEARLERIRKKWIESSGIRNLGRILLPYGISNSLIVRIHEYFGNEATQIVISEPYRLTEIRGIGFKTADEVALKLGISPDDPQRLVACTKYCLMKYMADNGHTKMRLGDLIVAIKDEIKAGDIDISVDEKNIIDAINEMIRRHDENSRDNFAIRKVKGEMPDPDCYVTLPFYAIFEERIFSEFENIRGKGPIVRNIEEWINAYETKFGKKFGEQQRKAILLANNDPSALAVTGYAGTGKTTTAKAILDLLSMRYPKEQIVACALSGIAANRIRQQTGFHAYTIHSLLGYSEKGWKYKKDNPLPHKVILLDESSMVDSEILYRLLSAINFENGARIIFLGDPAQLPPVGAGQPFQDLLNNERIPNVILDKIYRQSEDKVITTFAAEVRNGRPPRGYKNGGYSDFRFELETIPNYWNLRKKLSQKEIDELREKSNSAIRDKIVSEARKHSDHLQDLYRKGDFLSYITWFQVLSPIKKGLLGTEELNRLIQEAINPNRGQAFMKSGSRTFRVGDKVVHLQNKNMEVIPINGTTNTMKIKDSLLCRNEKTERVFNGQLGVVIHIEDDELYVFYPNERYVTVYGQIDVSGRIIDHAWCLSVHKAQGSEFMHVTIPISISHYIMLDPKLLYTAMTRAKESLVLIGQDFAFDLGCKRKSAAERSTCMQIFAEQRVDRDCQANADEKHGIVRQRSLEF